MSDTKEMIELAAKALEYTVFQVSNGVFLNCTGMHPIQNALAAPPWRPLTDQADSDRMACDLFISTRITPVEAYAVNALVGKVVDACVAHDGTIEGCRAAVRETRMQVAAQLGKLKGTS